MSERTCKITVATRNKRHPLHCYHGNESNTLNSKKMNETHTKIFKLTKSKIS